MKEAKGIATELLKPKPKYLTREELAVFLNVSVRKVDQMVASKEIPVVRFGTAVRFRLEDVERRISQRMLTDAEAKAED